MAQDYKDEIKTIHTSIASDFDSFDSDTKAGDTIDVTGNTTLKFSYTGIINNLSISSKNAHNASFSFSKTDVSSHVGFSKSITFGDSYSMRHSKSKLKDAKHLDKQPTTKNKIESFNSANTISFNIGDSISISKLGDKKSRQHKESYSLQKGETSDSESSVIGDKTSVNCSSEVASYEKNDTTRQSSSLYGMYLSFSLGLIQYKIRMARLSIYVANFNTNNFLASSRVVHFFFSIYALKQKKSWVTSLLDENKVASVIGCYSNLYSRDSAFTHTFKSRLTTDKSSAGFIKVNLNSSIATLAKTNEHMSVV